MRDLPLRRALSQSLAPANNGQFMHGIQHMRGAASESASAPSSHNAADPVEQNDVCRTKLKLPCQTDSELDATLLPSLIYQLKSVVNPFFCGRVSIALDKDCFYCIVINHAKIPLIRRHRPSIARWDASVHQIKLEMASSTSRIEHTERPPGSLLKVFRWRLSN